MATGVPSERTTRRRITCFAGLEELLEEEVYERREVDRLTGASSGSEKVDERPPEVAAAEAEDDDEDSAFALPFS